MLRTLLLFMIAGAAFGSVSITMKGKWVPTCDGIEISSHNRFDKALEASINHGSDCDIIPPSRFEIRHREAQTEPEPEPEAEPETHIIELSWSIPTQRENGTELKESDIEGYFIYADNVQYFVFEGNATSYTLELFKGPHSFTISTLTIDGIEGAQSQIININ